MATKSVGVIHPEFHDRVRELAEQAALQAEAARAGGARPWQVPAGLEETGDVAGLAAPYSREAIGANVEEVLASAKEPGTVGDVVALQAQSDVLAALERATRARLASPVRCLAHALGRRAAHGDAAGVLAGGIMQFVQDALAAGKGG